MNAVDPRRVFRVLCGLAWMGCPSPSPIRADELPTFAGPAMGTVYRVTLAEELPGMAQGEVHRDVEGVLARLDRALSTWRADSDASRFNRAAAGAWVEVARELVETVEIARRVHADSGGAFDITCAAAGSGRPVGMRHLATRSGPPALRKHVAGIAVDLGGIGPGYAVDAIGERLAELGSRSHLVELGGEVRAWGRRPGGAWRVALAGSGHVIELADGEAVATASARPGRSPIDPRSGRVIDAAATSVSVRAATCAEADAWAVAAVVLGLPPGPDGTVEPPVRARP
jgi:thiamine biosynthesis lipoprotein